MNSYSISRPWFDFAYENPSKVTMAHNALMFALIEINNRCSWKKEFGVTAKECMELMCCKSYNTYKKTLDDLIEYGFVNLVVKSANQYKCNVIALSKYDKPLDKALDKALIKHSINQSESTVQSTGDIHKQQTINNKTIEQEPQADKVEEVKEKVKKTTLIADTSEKNTRREIFEAARKAYKGTKNGADPEWENFEKKYHKHQNFKELPGLIKDAVEKQIKHREALVATKAKFIPEWPYFSTWINNQRWEEELPELTENKPAGFVNPAYRKKPAGVEWI